MKRKSELEAAKERKRAYYAKLYADPEYRARKQEYARNRHAEKRADPEWHTAHKKTRRKYYRTGGSSCLTANAPRSGLTPSSPPIRNGANGTMRNDATGTKMIQHSGQDN